MIVPSSRDEPGVSRHVQMSYHKFPVTDTNTELLGVPSIYVHLKLKYLFIKIVIVIGKIRFTNTLAIKREMVPIFMLQSFSYVRVCSKEVLCNIFVFSVSIFSRWPTLYRFMGLFTCLVVQRSDMWLKMEISWCDYLVHKYGLKWNSSHVFDIQPS